jgi:predicted permease
MIRAFFARLRHLGRRSRAEASLADELRFHLEMEAEENLRAGLPPEEARRRALVALGGVEQAKEAGREAWAVRWLPNLAQDLCYALRTYRRSSGFAAVVVLTLAAGIGLNVALFTVINTLFWAPARIHDPSRVVDVKFWYLNLGTPSCSYSQYLILKENTTPLSDVAAYRRAGGDSLYGRWSGRFASSNYLDLLGARMSLGRNFTADEERVKTPVIVLSYRTWQKDLGGDRAILGRVIRLTGLTDTAHSFTVIGVTSPDFGGPDPVIPDFWVPLSLAPDYQLVGVIGRLAPGISLEQARTALDALSRRLPVEDPRRPIVGVQVASKEHLYPPPRDEDINRRYLPLMVAFGLFLLIACANVANLLLARSATRWREVAVRLSLGASRARLVGQMLTESAVLACAGGALSLLFAQALVRLALEAGGWRIFVEALWAPDFHLNVRLDLNVYLYTLLVSVIASLALGLVPALSSTGFDLSLTMKGGCLDVLGRQQASRPRDRLVALQVAACLVILAGTGLLLRSVMNALTFDPGFNPKDVYQLRVMKRGWGASDPLLQSAFAERVRPLPPVKALSVGKIDDIGSIIVRGAEPDQRVQLFYNAVTPDYFRALELPILHGRQFTPSEAASRAPAAIVSEAAVRALWGGQNPIGRRIEVHGRSMGSGSGPYRGGSSVCQYMPRQGEAFDVIGVTRDLQSVSLSERGQRVLPHIYIPRPADPCTNSILIRVAGDAQSAMQTLRGELRALDPEAALDVFPVIEWYLRDLQQIEWLSSVAGMLGGLALLLASMGLYALMSYSVTQRTKEIGVRMALGAARKSVLWLVMGRGLKLALAGAIPGVGLAALLASYIGPYLFKVSPYDPLIFTAVPALLIAVCLVAAYIPARRATRVDPMVALRQE